MKLLFILYECSIIIYYLLLSMVIIRLLQIDIKIIIKSIYSILMVSIILIITICYLYIFKNRRLYNICLPLIFILRLGVGDQISGFIIIGITIRYLLDSRKIIDVLFIIIQRIVYMQKILFGIVQYIVIMRMDGRGGGRGSISS